MSITPTLISRRPGLVEVVVHSRRTEKAEDTLLRAARCAAQPARDPGHYLCARLDWLTVRHRTALLRGSMATLSRLCVYLFCVMQLVKMRIPSLMCAQRTSRPTELSCVREVFSFETVSVSVHLTSSFVSSTYRVLHFVLCSSLFFLVALYVVFV